MNRQSNTLILLLLSILLATQSSWARMSDPSEPYASKQDLLKAFHRAGFPTVFEFHTAIDGFLVHIPDETSDDGVDTFTLDRYEEDIDSLDRIPSLDFKRGNSLVNKVTFGRLGGTTMRAFKLSDFAICYQPSEEHQLNLGWEFCLAVPTPVDYVIARIERSK